MEKKKQQETLTFCNNNRSLRTNQYAELGFVGKVRSLFFSVYYFIDSPNSIQKQRSTDFVLPSRKDEKRIDVQSTSISFSAELGFFEGIIN